MQPNFAQVEDELYRLKGQLAAGRISREQFEAASKNLMVQDARGRWWMLDRESVKWNVYDGAKWVEANPDSSAATMASPPRPGDMPEAASPPRSGGAPNLAPQPFSQTPAQQVAPPPAKKGSGCGGCLLPGCLAIILLIVVGGVGGFLAVQSGALTPQTALKVLLNVTGQGPADIEVDNFRDDAIEVAFQQTDAAKDSSAASGSLSLNAFDVKTYHAPNPGRYLVSFASGADSSSTLGTCTLTVHGGDQYQFVALPDKIVINRVNNPSSAGTDFVVDSSSLCR
jgi:hypothetical protein